MRAIDSFNHYTIGRETNYHDLIRLGIGFAVRKYTWFGDVKLSFGCVQGGRETLVVSEW